jgi:hypothetical protein
MNQKVEITRYLANTLDPAVDKKTLKKYLNTWWYNTRLKEKGGLRLTDKGFETLTQAGFESHRVKFQQPIEYTNRLIIQLENFITCPWYVTARCIYVFDDKMAVQLVMFGGDLAKYGQVRANSIKNN